MVAVVHRNYAASLRSRRSLLAMVLLALWGCSQPPVVRNPACPPPPAPVCSPGSFDKTLLDTNAHGLTYTQYHITMLPAPPNSSVQDFAIGFVPSSGGEIALVTSNRASAESDNGETGVQKLYSARMYSTTRYGPLHDVQIADAPQEMGAGFYSRADHLFYFSAKANNSDPDDFDLYRARISVSGDVVSLTDVRPLTAVNSHGNFDSQPTLDPSGTHLYFVSDRPGGDGGTDIWYSSRSSAHSEDWSEPQPLPEPLNTPCDEISPFVPSYDSNTLYFASNGHETVGGYDLFKSHVEDGRFSEPENLGKPINTASDEVFPTALNDTALFWSSNRPANQAGMNLYTITRTRGKEIAAHPEVQPPERPKVGHLHLDTTRVVAAPKPLGPVEIIANVTQGADYHPAAGANIFVREDSQKIFDGTVPASGMIGFKVNRGAEYDVGAEAEQTFFDVRHVQVRSTTDSIIHVYLHLPDTLVIRINFPFDDYAHPYEYTIDENGQPSSLTWQHALDLTAQSVLQSVKSLKALVLIGHTDSLGSDAYNDNLGFERATFVARELERRGVPPDAVKVESMGRREPVVRRPGESDETFRLRSRRVEFIKVFK